MAEEEEARSAGVVAEWKSRGYGFITPDSGSRDLFFHASDVELGPVSPGTRVSFGVTETAKGQRAARVRTDRPAAGAAAPSEDVEADLLSPDELWSEIAPGLRRVVEDVARMHNWLE